MKRRQFLSSAAATGAFLALPSLAIKGHGARAATPRRLQADSRILDINGKSAKVFSLVNDHGAQGLALAPGERFTVELTNALAEDTIIHWHGLTPPFEQDGVPDNPLPMLQPSESRSYDFAVGKPGTFWMHAHTLQEQNLLAAPLIVHSQEDLSADRQEVVMLLHDFSFTPAEELLNSLNGGKGMTHKPGDMHSMGMDMGSMDMSSMGGMDMSGEMDLNDISYDAYLANDRTLDDPEVVSVEKGGKVLLRIINAGASTAFTVSTGGLAASLQAVDGRPVQPVAGSEFPLSMAQRIDLLVTIPKDGGQFPVLALREGAIERTGIILASQGTTVTKLSTNAEKAGPVLGLDLEMRLRSLEPLANRPADKAYAVHLAGNMMTYQWGMMGAEKISANLGERIEITMMNMSMMAHPMHLHGHDFQIVAIDGQRFSGATRDTVMVPPMRSVTIGVDMTNPGNWPFHCHHLYHMVSGMMVHIPVGQTG